MLGKLLLREALIARSYLEVADRLVVEEQAIPAEMAHVVKKGDSEFWGDVEV